MIEPEVGLFQNDLDIIKFQPRYVMGGQRYGAFWMEWADKRPMTWRWCQLGTDNAPPEPDGEYKYFVKKEDTREAAIDFVVTHKMATTWREIPDDNQ